MVSVKKPTSYPGHPVLLLATDNNVVQAERFDVSG